MMILAYTGCRPIEAAWIVTRGDITANPFDHHDRTYIANCPELIAKTGSNYMWLLPKEFDGLWKKIKGNLGEDWRPLYRSLNYFYGKLLV